MSVFSARYAGTCPNCDRQIEVGDLVTWDDDTVVHAEDCTTTDVDVVACSRCFMVPALNGRCGCE